MGVSQAAIAQFEATSAKLRKASRDKLAVALGLTGFAGFIADGVVAAAEPVA